MKPVITETDYQTKISNAIDNIVEYLDDHKQSPNTDLGASFKLAIEKLSTELKLVEKDG